MGAPDFGFLPLRGRDSDPSHVVSSAALVRRGECFSPIMIRGRREHIRGRTHLLPRNGTACLGAPDFGFLPLRGRDSDPSPSDYRAAHKMGKRVTSSAY